MVTVAQAGRRRVRAVVSVPGRAAASAAGSLTFGRVLLGAALLWLAAALISTGGASLEDDSLSAHSAQVELVAFGNSSDPDEGDTVNSSDLFAGNGKNSAAEQHLNDRVATAVATPARSLNELRDRYQRPADTETATWPILEIRNGHDNALSNGHGNGPSIGHSDGRGNGHGDATGGHASVATTDPGRLTSTVTEPILDWESRLLDRLAAGAQPAARGVASRAVPDSAPAHTPAAPATARERRPALPTTVDAGTTELTAALRRVGALTSSTGTNTATGTPYSGEPAGTNAARAAGGGSTDPSTRRGASAQQVDRILDGFVDAVSGIVTAVAGQRAGGQTRQALTELAREVSTALVASNQLRTDGAGGSTPTGDRQATMPGARPGKQAGTGSALSPERGWRPPGSARPGPVGTDEHPAAGREPLGQPGRGPPARWNGPNQDDSLRPITGQRPERPSSPAQAVMKASAGDPGLIGKILDAVFEFALRAIAKGTSGQSAPNLDKQSEDLARTIAGLVSRAGGPEAGQRTEDAFNTLFDRLTHRPDSAAQDGYDDSAEHTDRVLQGRIAIAKGEAALAAEKQKVAANKGNAAAYAEHVKAQQDLVNKVDADAATLSPERSALIDRVVQGNVEQQRQQTQFDAERKQLAAGKVSRAQFEATQARLIATRARVYADTKELAQATGHNTDVQLAAGDTPTSGCTTSGAFAECAAYAGRDPTGNDEQRATRCMALSGISSCAATAAAGAKQDQRASAACDLTGSNPHCGVGADATTDTGRKAATTNCDVRGDCVLTARSGPDGATSRCESATGCHGVASAPAPKGVVQDRVVASASCPGQCVTTVTSSLGGVSADCRSTKGGCDAHNSGKRSGQLSQQGDSQGHCAGGATGCHVTASLALNASGDGANAAGGLDCGGVSGCYGNGVATTSATSPNRTTNGAGNCKVKVGGCGATAGSATPLAADGLTRDGHSHTAAQVRCAGLAECTGDGRADTAGRGAGDPVTNPTTGRTAPASWKSSSATGGCTTTSGDCDGTSDTLTAVDTNTPGRIRALHSDSSGDGSLDCPQSDGHCAGTVYTRATAADASYSGGQPRTSTGSGGCQVTGGSCRADSNSLATSGTGFPGPGQTEAPGPSSTSTSTASVTCPTANCTGSAWSAASTFDNTGTHSTSHTVACTGGPCYAETNSTAGTNTQPSSSWNYRPQATPAGATGTPGGNGGGSGCGPNDCPVRPSATTGPATGAPVTNTSVSNTPGADRSAQSTNSADSSATPGVLGNAANYPSRLIASRWDRRGGDRGWPGTPPAGAPAPGGAAFGGAPSVGSSSASGPAAVLGDDASSGAFTGATTAPAGAGIPRSGRGSATARGPPPADATLHTSLQALTSRLATWGLSHARTRTDPSHPP